MLAGGLALRPPVRASPRCGSPSRRPCQAGRLSRRSAPCSPPLGARCPTAAMLPTLLAGLARGLFAPRLVRSGPDRDCGAADAAAGARNAAGARPRSSAPLRPASRRGFRFKRGGRCVGFDRSSVPLRRWQGRPQRQQQVRRSRRRGMRTPRPKRHHPGAAPAVFHLVRRRFGLRGLHRNRFGRLGERHGDRGARALLGEHNPAP